MESREEGMGIAYCIPTYNHPEVIDDILSKSIELYQKYHMDVYIYDSSADNRTQDVVTAYIVHGFDNLYYIKVDESVGIDDKMLMIFSGYGQKKEYKYIWPVKDRVYVEECTLKCVTENIENGYDAIFLIASLHPTVTESCRYVPEVYDDPAELYGAWGWLATSMNVTVFRVQTMLADVDWKEFKEQYFFNGESYFDQFVVLFHSLAQRQKCSVRIIPPKKAKFYTSSLGKSSWTARTFHVWANLWLKANDALPSCYDRYKSRTIKHATSLPWILGSYDQLIKLREDGILSKEVFAKIYSQWEAVSDIPAEEVVLIVCRQYQEVHNIINSRVNRLFESGDYVNASLLYRMNRWIIRNLGGNKEYMLLGDFLEIYHEELTGGVKKGIFCGISGYGDVERKYLKLKEILHNMECDSEEETWKEVRGFIQENAISSQFINRVINNTCTDKEKVLCILLKALQG